MHHVDFKTAMQRRSNISLGITFRDQRLSDLNLGE